jgi:hypothetical protein
MYEEEVVGSRGKEKKTNILPRMHVSKYWQYASGESKNEKKKIKKRREKEENKKQKKSAQDIRMSISPFHPSNVKFFPFLR